jgi:hypothetical protein
VWQFMTSPSQGQSESEYLNTLEHLRERCQEIAKDFVFNSGKPITPWMYEIQSLPLNAKSEMYLAQRLGDQIDWYTLRAGICIQREKQWFWATFSLEFIAVACSGIQALFLWRFNIVGSIAALSAAFIAWSQTRRFSELGSSYALTADDLSRLRQQYTRPDTRPATDLDLHQLVHRVETVVSLENKMWLARRM